MNRVFFIFLILMSQWVIADSAVIKSEVDKKQYRSLVLENGLTVLLISDPEADQAAAALDVHVGSGSDPDNWDGLAHFLEHMLFLGTKKYPQAGEYQRFIKNNGGSNNAYTAFDHTNYFFSIKADKLLPALDRFSRFFIDPTFDATYVDRERSVVHSEYQARRKNESRRIWDAGKKLINPSHPASGFSVGSKYTLRDRESASAREKLIAFYEQYYSSNIMALAVLGAQSPDQLEAWVVERFSQIPNKNIEVPVFDRPYLNAELLPARINILPEKDHNNLGFQFPIPSTKKEYRSKPIHYIANLLGHEGEGSLLARLKQRGWADGLSAGVGFMDDINGTVSLSIQLTEEGLRHVERIGELLFQTIALVESSGIEAWRYEEEHRLAEMSFQFAQESAAGRLVRSLAAGLHDYPAIEVLRGPYLMERFDAKRITELLSYLRPDNVNISVVSKTAETDSRTELYDVAYSIRPIDDKTIDQWTLSREGKTKADQNLFLPASNPFIPQRLTAQHLEHVNPIPVLQKGQDRLPVWYRADTDFKTPRASFYFNIMSPFANQSPRSLVLTEIFVRLVNDQLNKTVYPAYLAGLEYSLYRHGRGISVKINGFEDQQSALLKTIVEAILHPQYDDEKLQLIKSELVRKWKNVVKDSPSNRTINEIYRLVMDPFWTEEERLAVIDGILIEDLKNHVEAFFKQVELNVLSHGDVTLEKTAERAALLKPLFLESEIIPGIAAQPEPRTLSLKTPYLRTIEVDHSDSAFSVYFQGGDDTVAERAGMLLLGQLIESPYYHNLRTTHRVGYLVYASPLTILELPGLLLSAQSPTHSPYEINQLIMRFLSDFDKMLAEMDKADYEQIKQGLINSILKKDNKLSDRSARYWREIDREQWQFNSREALAEQISNLKLENMRSYFQETLVETPRKLIVQSAGHGEDGPAPLILPEGYTVTGDAVAFRSRFH